MNLSFLNDKTPLEAALYYAGELGWPVFPVWPPKRAGEGYVCSCGNPTCNTKHPIGYLATEGFKSATTDRDRITGWWGVKPDASIGLATGRGILVIDVDRHGFDGFINLPQAAAMDESILKSLYAETGGGGKHIFTRIPPEVGEIGNVDPWQGINIRADKGFVVAAPSLHLSGKKYQWPNEDLPLISMNLDLAQFLKNLEKTKEAIPIALSTSEIPEGQRNTTLYRLACRLRSHGNTYEDAEGVIRLYNMNCCKPPLHDEEVVSIVQKAYQKLPAFHWTDYGNAQRLQHFFGSEVLYVEGIGWLEWGAGSWEERSDLRIQKWAHLLVGMMHEAAKDIGDDKLREEYKKFVNSSESDAKLNAIVKRWRAIDPKFYGDFNKHRMLVPCLNGTYELETKKFRPSKKEDYMTGHFPVKYDPKAACPSWLKAVDVWAEGDKEMAKFLQRMVGYFITGDTSLHSIFILYGPGGTGKTTFTKTIQAMLGSYAITIDTGLLMKNGKVNKETESARLVGKRLAVAPESEHDAKMEASILKNLTGEDEMRGRKLYLDAFNFEATHKLILFTNERPVLPAWDTGAKRRLKMVPFPQVIPKDKIDRQLSVKFLQELPGILNWAIDGCLDWLGLGELGVVEKVAKETDKYWHDMDLIGMFLSERYEYDPASRVKRSELYPEYVSWCNEVRTHPLRKSKFLEDLRSRGEFREKQIDDDWYFTGLKFSGRTIAV